jgi:hypothetical protein
MWAALTMIGLDDRISTALGIPLAPLQFDPTIHHLAGLAEQFGGSQEAAFRAVEREVQAAVRDRDLGVFNITVRVGGQDVAVYGDVSSGRQVVDGEVRERFVIIYKCGIPTAGSRAKRGKGE